MKPKEPCRHHWLIAAPSGPISTGQCKLCGAEREFVNGLHYDYSGRNYGTIATLPPSAIGRWPRRHFVDDLEE